MPSLFADDATRLSLYKELSLYGMSTPVTSPRLIGRGVRGLLLTNTPRGYVWGVNKYQTLIPWSFSCQKNNLAPELNQFLNRMD